MCPTATMSWSCWIQLCRPTGLGTSLGCCGLANKGMICKMSFMYLCDTAPDIAAACGPVCVYPAVATAARTPTSANCQPGCISLDFLAGLAGLDSTCICLTKTITDVQHGLRATKEVCVTRVLQRGCAVLPACIWGMYVRTRTTAWSVGTSCMRASAQLVSLTQCGCCDPE
jgi:hypothetical protein